jgi:myo-inositol-1(or 4)-monophosphatase
MDKRISEAIKAIAREELCPRFARVIRSHKQDGSFLTEADLAMQERAQAFLQENYPTIAFLGEEMSEEQQRTMLDNPDGVWILDPLDGTSNFSAGIPYYAVSLALVKQGRIYWGMVYDPERDECFTASLGQGAYLNDAPLLRREAGVTLDKSTALIDFKRLDSALAARIASRPPYSSQRSFGGVALDWCWLAAGRVHIYLHGKQNIWDYAAGHLVFNEMGGYSCTLQGEPVFDFSLQPRSAVAALDENLFHGWADWLGIQK